MTAAHPIASATTRAQFQMQSTMPNARTGGLAPPAPYVAMARTARTVGLRYTVRSRCAHAPSSRHEHTTRGMCTGLPWQYSRDLQSTRNSLLLILSHNDPTALPSRGRVTPPSPPRPAPQHASTHQAPMATAVRSTRMAPWNARNMPPGRRVPNGGHQANGVRLGHSLTLEMMLHIRIRTRTRTRETRALTAVAATPGDSHAQLPVVCHRVSQE